MEAVARMLEEGGDLPPLPEDTVRAAELQPSRSPRTRLGPVMQWNSAFDLLHSRRCHACQPHAAAPHPCCRP